MNNCKKCGARCEKELCWKCKPHKKLKSSPIQKKRKKLTKENIEDIEKMNSFFIGIWNKKPHVSEISGEKLIGEPKNYYFHHIYEKSSYPEWKYNEENIILVTFQEHQNIHLNPTRYEEVNKRKEYLKTKYNIL